MRIHFKHGSIFLHLFTALCLFTLCRQAQAQPQLTFTPFIQGLNLPIDLRDAGDGSGRLFICEQGGLVKIYKNGNLLNKPFLDISGIVKDGGEYPGLYCIAFAPDYINNRTFFIYYISNEGNTVIARYQASKTNPDSAIAGSAVILLSIAGRGTGGSHTGDMHFGRDGYLYITFNDGSFYNSTTNFAQDGQSLLGKMIRIDVREKQVPYYKIPPDNPFVSTPSVRDEIWALGLRNAWRWSFDRLNGNMWIADVGGDLREEVNVRTPAQMTGVNFGWPCYEGNQVFDTTGCKNIRRYVFPVFEYPHAGKTSAEVITGGFVYRGSAYPGLKGFYICADYTTGDLWLVKKAGGIYQAFRQTGLPLNIVDFSEDENGELYAASLSDGTVYRVTAAGFAVAARITKEK